MGFKFFKESIDEVCQIYHETYCILMYTIILMLIIIFLIGSTFFKRDRITIISLQVIRKTGV